MRDTGWKGVCPSGRQVSLAGTQCGQEARPGGSAHASELLQLLGSEEVWQEAGENILMVSLRSSQDGELQNLQYRFSRSLSAQ